jgi:hypothetical protein
MILLHPPLVAEPGQGRHRRPQPRSKPMRDPRPFVVIQNGTFLFVIHAYSLEQARALVAAKVAGETIVVARDGASR